MLMLEGAHFIKGLDPVADAFASTVYSDIINMSDLNKLVFVVYKGVGTTGTSTITVEASDDVSGSNVTAIPFRYRAITTGDTQGTLTAATTAGFATTAGSSQLYVIEVDAAELGDTGYKYARLKAAEVVDSAVVGCILAFGFEKRYSNLSTAIV